MLFSWVRAQIRRKWRRNFLNFVSKVLRYLSAFSKAKNELGTTSKTEITLWEIRNKSATFITSKKDSVFDHTFHNTWANTSTTSEPIPRTLRHRLRHQYSNKKSQGFHRLGQAREPKLPMPPRLTTITMLSHNTKSNRRSHYRAHNTNLGIIIDSVDKKRHDAQHNTTSQNRNTTKGISIKTYNT